MNDVDIFQEFQDAAETDEQEKEKEIDLGRISRLVDIQAAMEREPDINNVRNLYHYIKTVGLSNKDVEEALKLLGKDLFRVKQQQIPELMDEYGLESITTKSGDTIKVEKGLSLSVRDHDKLHAYLREHNYGDLIKNVITIPIKKESLRKEVTDFLQANNTPYEQKEAVHHSTLKAHIKRGLETGQVPGDDIVNIHEYKYSKIK